MHALAQAAAEASLDDLDWADVVLFGTPTRFGNVASQLKAFIDTTGPLWAQPESVTASGGALSSRGKQIRHR